jgi:hypothetical protein
MQKTEPEAPDRAGGRSRLAPVPLLLLLLAIGAAETLYTLRAEPITYDAGQYLGLAQDIGRKRTLRVSTVTRPLQNLRLSLFVRTVAAPRGLDNGAFVRWAVFHAQLGAPLLAAAVAGHVIARVTARPRLGVAVFGVTALNPFLLSHTVSLRAVMPGASRGRVVGSATSRLPVRPSAHASGLSLEADPRDIGTRLRSRPDAMSPSPDEIAEKFIYPALREILPPEAAPSDLTRGTVLLGKAAVLDSLGLVSLITIVEGSIREQIGAGVVLANEAAMSRSRSPFHSVGTLANYIQEVLSAPTSQP